MAKEYKYAGFGKRLVAYLIDGLIFIPIELASQSVANLQLIIYIVLWFAYMTWMNGKFGATIGKQVMKLKIIKENGSPINYSDALVREIASYLSAIVLFIGYLVVIGDKKKQSWHDKLAHTYVVEN